MFVPSTLDGHDFILLPENLKIERFRAEDMSSAMAVAALVAENKNRSKHSYWDMNGVMRNIKLQLQVNCDLL